MGRWGRGRKDLGWRSALGRGHLIFIVGIGQLLLSLRFFSSFRAVDSTSFRSGYLPRLVTCDRFMLCVGDNGGVQNGGHARMARWKPSFSVGTQVRAVRRHESSDGGEEEPPEQNGSSLSEGKA